MTTKHTPGPWKQDTIWGLIKYGNAEICALHSGNAANARLIAAAPEMLDTLKSVLVLAELHDIEGAEVDNIKSIIAKVEGVTND